MNDHDDQNTKQDTLGFLSALTAPQSQAATTPTLTHPGSVIFANVCAALQDAEEIWGLPECVGYQALMDAVIAECQQRKTNALAQEGT